MVVQVIEQQSDTGIVVCPIDKSQAETINMAYNNRARDCFDSLPNKFWLTRAKSNENYQVGHHLQEINPWRSHLRRDGQVYIDTIFKTKILNLKRE